MGVYFWVKDFLSRPSLGWLGRIGLGPLTVAAWLYGRVLGLRRWMYRCEILRGQRVDVPVVSVGNVTVGGTGKTPCVEAVCRQLLSLGVRPAVLSRGYGGGYQGEWAAVSDGKRVLLDSSAAGDEPVLLAKHLPGVPVLVGRDRRVTARIAVERYGVGALVLDDGLQHLRLARDLDVVTVDARVPFGNGHCLPRGLLRESPWALAGTGLIFLTRTAGLEPDRLTEALERVGRYAPSTPIVPTDHAPVALVAVPGGRLWPLAVLDQLKVLAFAGIGSPGTFFKQLEGLGARVLEAVPFPDHHAYTLAELEQLERWAGLMNAEVIVTTEKDAVRLGPHLPRPLPLLALRIEFDQADQGVALRNQLAELVGPRGGARQQATGEHGCPSEPTAVC